MEVRAAGDGGLADASLVATAVTQVHASLAVALEDVAVAAIADTPEAAVGEREPREIVFGLPVQVRRRTPLAEGARNSSDDDWMTGLL